ncbi:MotA/TolQ/ExbB proton channel family protein [Compostibacter hankyongensis]|uniref:MotA/TolQ/ExbB proton channel family protein n=1 Tax=Compostibacter hankyongensis TaxID=1007089 RepID=A0ABP8G7H1_9BACT
MSGFFLQIQDTVLQAADSLNQIGTPVAGADEHINLFSLLVKGGVLMIPLAVLLLIAIYFFFERFIAIKKAGRIDNNFMFMIRDHITSGNVQSARSLAKNTDNPAARMIEKGLQRIGKPIDNIEKAMENTGKLQVYHVEKNLIILSMIAAIAPMFGFLGTIAGMIQLFFDIAITSDITLGTIAGGIYVKMITSATGLVIGILAYIGHHYLSAQIDKLVYKMEAASAEFIDILQEPTR